MTDDTPAFIFSERDETPVAPAGSDIPLHWKMHARPGEDFAALCIRSAQEQVRRPMQGMVGSECAD
ncbi:MAG: hypothetical protein PHS73_05305 [Candidatus Peribacteraceae bacterium]|nr:hypothetical protein [Candidatus Peribacteraceae bacterium]